ncbi:S-layer homology domain-containing protein [Cohnella ginsengisoli]|uniref:S-layer homology domain-containing protein n=1 Tax=Cohnella ginsengisoli TaxID=425004 RepID=A0A9X4KJJ1_9BACL|nr:S-layer homology domain-containing protein [Cohnella ginsengisoli]MDG0792624.1 S-layer homology domain-containing protein [Cohnella ginsengisoli]
MAWGKGVKVWACAIALSMLGTGWGSAASAAELPGHWAQDTLNAWMNKGWLAGFGSGGLQPDQPVTRAEFATLAVRAFGLQADGAGAGKYSDVREGSWYAGAIYAAAGAGILSGYPDGTIRPSRSVTREEAAVVLAKLDGLSETGAIEPAFSDASDVRSWSKASVGSAVYSKLLGGYPDGTFRPAKAMTRAEAVVALDKAWALRERTRTTVYDKAGVCGPAEGTQEIAGSVSIAAPGVTLRNTVVRGDLTIGAEVGEGDAQLEGVTVDGKLTVAGGGEHSVHLSNAKLGQVVVNKLAGKLRLVLEGTTFVTQLDFRTQGLLVVPPGSSVGSLNAYAVIFVTGSGKINAAHLFVSGSSFEQAPGSVEREAGVLLQGETGATGGNASSGGNAPTPAPTPSEEPSPSPSPSAGPSPSPSPSAEPTPTPGPVINGVKDGKTYTAAVTPELGDGSDMASLELTKDGKPVADFELGGELSETGAYVLTATNAGGGETVIRFKLSADVKLSVNDYDYTKFEGILKVRVHVDNQGLDLYNAVNGIELTLPYYEGDMLEVDYSYAGEEDWSAFDLVRVEGTDRFVGHYPQEPYKPYDLPAGTAFDLDYEVYIDPSTKDRDLSLKAWISDASALSEEAALFKLDPLLVPLAFDSLGPISDLSVDDTQPNDASTVTLKFSEPVEATYYYIEYQDGVKFKDYFTFYMGELDRSANHVTLKGLTPGLNYKFLLVVSDGYNQGRSNEVEYTTPNLPPPPQPSE